jgi:heat shock protein HslJ
VNADGRPLEGTYWNATELVGRVVPSQESPQEPHLIFQDGRLSGSDGCNRVAGPYQLRGDVVTFGPIASTRMACADVRDIDRAFEEALGRATRLTIAGDQLQLFDAAGQRVAMFEARLQPSPPNR